MTKIANIFAREILDSRGNPTIEVDLELNDGAMGRASVPSGASTGSRESVELRDADATRFGGRGVLSAIAKIREIELASTGISFDDQWSLDKFLLELDGTGDKSKLGSNAILGVSMAFAHASSSSHKLPLYRYFSETNPLSLPVPMFNVLNGGKHAEGSTDIQEFMVVPAGFDFFREAVRAGAEVYSALREILRARGGHTNVGDEGGFAVEIESSHAEALDVIVEAIDSAGYSPGKQCFIALDIAANELISNDGRYVLKHENVSLSSSDLLNLYELWVNNYPIISIEDGMGENDWNGWIEMTNRLGSQVQLVGDDLYTTNPDSIRMGIEQKASNAVLIKLNQIGTVTETKEAVSIAKSAGWGTIASHRSGETEDTTLADFAVGMNTHQVKAGAPGRGERTAKYNRLLRIEEELGDTAFAGPLTYQKYLV